MVVFYGSNTWAYTRLGHISDKTPDELNKMGVKNRTDLADGYEHDYKFRRQCFYNYLTKIFS